MPGRAVKVKSLAKINLDLRVLHRRADGYHELRTVFQTISLADTLKIEFHTGGPSAVVLSSRIAIPNNLILKAAELVLTATKTEGRVFVHLDKRIPLGGGLGGGSSNAAATLLALPVLTRQPLPHEQLMELAVQLGSDVPFFLCGGTALGLGRGTELYPVPEPGPLSALLVTPGVHVSTPGAYRSLNRPTARAALSSVTDPFESVASQIADKKPPRDWTAVNDFEPVVFGNSPELESIKAKLLRLGARPALMSGSGSSLFGIFDTRAKRDKAAASLRAWLGKEKVHPVSLVSRRQYRSMWWNQLGPHVRDKQWPPRSRIVQEFIF